MRKTCFLNARFLSQSVTGVQRYAIELVKSLDNLIECGEIDSKQYSFILLAPQELNYELNLRNIPLKRVGYFKGHIWEQFELPYYARNGLLVNLCNTASIFKFHQTVTIHDATVYNYPKSYSFIFRNWYKILFNVLGRNVSKVMTDSLYSKNDLIKYCKMDSNKIRTIYLGKEHILNVDKQDYFIEERNLKSGNYIFAVSSLSPNKNFQSIVEAISLLSHDDLNFVIAGGSDPRIYGDMKLSISNQITYLGYISDNELRSLYENAACFIYPSFYEGFGLPPLEAMACGCPVIVSNAASLPEVCGDAALYCNPHDPNDIAEKIKLMMGDKQLRESYRVKGLERAKQFTWEKSARETFEVIQEVLGK